MEYKEFQKFNQWKLWILFFFLFITVTMPVWNYWSAVGELDKILLIGPVLMILVMILHATAELRTVITDEGIEVKFWPFSRKRIFKSEIKRALVRKDIPSSEFSGLGYRIGKLGKASTMKGNHGLELEFMDGDRMTIGTQKPDELAAFIKEYMEDHKVLDDEAVNMKLKELQENKLVR